MASPLRLLTYLVAIGVLLGGDAFAQRRQDSARDHAAKMDRALSDETQLPSRPRVIVKYRAGQGERVRQRLEARGHQRSRDLRSVGALSLELPADALAATVADPDVIGVSIDAIVTAAGRPSYSGPRWSPYRKSGGRTFQGLRDHGRPFVRPGRRPSAPSYPFYRWYDTQALRQSLGIGSKDTGNGVGIALIDSGISPSLDLQGRIAAFYDFTRGGIATAPVDPYGHGTHIAGLIVGNGRASNGRFVGVASQARLIGLRVLDENGEGYTSDVIAAIEFAIARRHALGIDIINLSLGHPVLEPAATDPLVQAVERAVAAGIVVVASAGNNGINPETGEIGFGGINSPGNAPSALTVGSLRSRKNGDRRDDEVSDFSSRGPTWYDGLIKPDILAPGQGLISIANANSKLYKNPILRAAVTPYLRLSGSSMATGIASGVVALVIDAHRRDSPGAPALTPNLVKAIVQYTAIPLKDDDPSTPSVLEQGAGGINAAGAIALARAIDTTMPAGSYWLEHGLVPETQIRGERYVWAQHIVWGDHVVWGDTIASNMLAWSEHIVWGDSEHIVWGDSFPQGVNVVADSFPVWSTHIVWGDAVQVLRGSSDEHIVWGDMSLEHIVWGDSEEHIVWGDFDEHIVWGDSLVDGVASTMSNLFGW